MYDQIKLRAKLAGVAAAEVIRDLIESSLEKPAAKSDDNWLLDWSNLGATGGPSDLSTHIEEFLYGEYKKTKQFAVPTGERYY